MEPMYIGLGVVAFLVLVVVGIYNGLVRKRNDVENAFASIDVYLKKRYDLIPQLIETVKGYMKHEQETLTNITKYRSQAMSGNVSTDERVDLENKITKSIGNIMVAVESYPDLKASSNFMNLQKNMTEMESQLSAARRTFNAAVTEFNNGVETFPSNILAGMFGFKRKEVFAVAEEQRAAMEARPEVKF